MDKEQLQQSPYAKPLNLDLSTHRNSQSYSKGLTLTSTTATGSIYQRVKTAKSITSGIGGHRRYYSYISNQVNQESE